MPNSTNSLTYVALQKFKKNFWGVFSFWFIVVCAFISVFAYALAPDSTRNANQMHLSIHSKPMGFETLMLHIPSTLAREQSFIDRFFFGELNSDTALPITSFSIKNDDAIV